jgi:hypothetical protein
MRGTTIDRKRCRTSIRLSRSEDGSARGERHGTGFGRDDGTERYSAAAHDDFRTPPPPQNDFRSIEEEKQFYLQKINGFNARGIPSHRRVSIETPIDKLKFEYHRLKRQQEVNHSIKFQRRVLMASVTGMEFVNKRFNVLGIHLDGWSESMMDSIEEYDPVFQSLHDKYSGTRQS